MSSNLPDRLDDGVADASVFLEHSGIPSFLGPISDIYNYVERKGREVGEDIKNNRGVPPGASRENMLTREEKAIGILGHAIGMPVQEIILRVNHLRVTQGIDPVESVNPRIFYERHRGIVAAIQEDMFASLEAVSPLVNPKQRFAMHATLMEYYRRCLMRVIFSNDEVTEGDTDKNGNLITIEKHRAVMKLDAAMQPHMKWFDRIAADPKFAEKMAPPSEQIRKAHDAERMAETMIQEKFDRGEITDNERIDLMRELKHGREVVDEE